MSETIDHYVMDYSNSTESSYEWTFFKFAMEIAKRDGLISRHVIVEDGFSISTSLYGPDSEEYTIATKFNLYCGEMFDGRRRPIPWQDVTTDMVNKFLEELANEFADYIHRSHICGLSDSEPREGTTLEDRVLKLKGIVEKVMPDKIPSYLHMSEDMSRDVLGRFHEEDVNNCLIQAMKYDLIDYISNI
jgi:hypothetical protein